MSSVKTLVGYNRNHFLNTTTKVDTLGTSLVSGTGDILVLPAGWSIIEIQVKKASTVNLGGSADNIIIYLLEETTQFPVLTVSKADLNNKPHIMLAGAKGSPINLAAFNDRFIMVKTDTDNLGADGYNGSSVKVIIKIARDNDEPVQIQNIIVF